MCRDSVLLRFWHYPLMTLAPGRRLVLWFQGCDIHCEGCIAPELQAFDERYCVTVEELMREISPALIDSEGVTISGGEATCQLEELMYLLERLNACGVRDILLYTGKRICEVPAEVLGMVAAVVDGEFVSVAITSVKWKGSENQTLTILREEFREKYEQWQNDIERSIQLVSKGGKKFLLGIPRQEDDMRKRLAARLRGGEKQ